MKSMEEIANEQVLTEDLDAQYDEIIESLQKAKNEKMPIDEGFFKSIFGGLVGATAGPAMMKALCEALGVDIKGAFGSLLTSRVILTIIGAKLGWRS